MVTNSVTHSLSTTRKKEDLFKIQKKKKSKNWTVFPHFLWCGPIHRDDSVSLKPPLPAAATDRVPCVCVHWCVRAFLSLLGSYYGLIPLKYFRKKNRGGGGRPPASEASAHAPLNLCAAHNETFIFTAPTVGNGA